MIDRRMFVKMLGAVAALPLAALMVPEQKAAGTLLLRPGRNNPLSSLLIERQHAAMQHAKMIELAMWGDVQGRVKVRLKEAR